MKTFFLFQKTFYTKRDLRDEICFNKNNSNEEKNCDFTI